MLSKRIVSILPDLTMEEMLEVTKIHSVMGCLSNKNPIITKRPYRAPHHTISAKALVGGGKNPQPGEISLANKGVLFLDELPEFKQSTLEVLRQPMEEKKITITRLNSTVTYPCDFMLIASMNPCQCGYYGSTKKKCTCSKKDIQRYLNRISGPLLDRIDIQVEVNSIQYKDLDSKKQNETSLQIRERINKAKQIQIERYKKYQIYSNSELPTKLIEKYCKLDSKSKSLLQKVYNELGLSVRAHNKILKVARTIADLENKENIETKHIAEAIQYRSLDKKYWRN